jgi:hypothetical protein
MIGGNGRCTIRAQSWKIRQIEANEVPAWLHGKTTQLTGFSMQITHSFLISGASVFVGVWTDLVSAKDAERSSCRQPVFVKLNS